MKPAEAGLLVETRATKMSLKLLRRVFSLQRKSELKSGVLHEWKLKVLRCVVQVNSGKFWTSYGTGSLLARCCSASLLTLVRVALLAVLSLRGWCVFLESGSTDRSFSELTIVDDLRRVPVLPPSGFGVEGKLQVISSLCSWVNVTVLACLESSRFFLQPKNVLFRY